MPAAPDEDEILPSFTEEDETHLCKIFWSDGGWPDGGNNSGDDHREETQAMSEGSASE